MVRARTLSLVLALSALACRVGLEPDLAGVEGGASGGADPSRRAEEGSLVDPGAALERAHEREHGALRPTYTPPSRLPAPRGIRLAERIRPVYAEPTKDSALRGRIPDGETFFTYDEREGEGCRAAWARRR